MEKYKISDAEFNKGIKAVESSAVKLRVLTHKLAMFSLSQINLHGNTNEINKLFVAMGPGLARDGLVKWSVNFGMVAFKDQKFVFTKRKDVSAQPENFLEMANETPYWEYSAAHKPADAKPFDIAHELVAILTKAKKVSDHKLKTYSEVAHAELLEKIVEILPKNGDKTEEIKEQALELTTQKEEVKPVQSKSPAKGKDKIVAHKAAA